MAGFSHGAKKKGARFLCVCVCVGIVSRSCSPFFRLKTRHKQMMLILQPLMSLQVHGY